MLGDDAITFLEKQTYRNESKKASQLLKRVLTECLGVKEEENILIITDKGFQEKEIAPALAYAYYIASKELNAKTTIAIQAPKCSSENADEDVMTALKNFPKKGVIISTLSNKLGEVSQLTKSYRKYLRIREHRYATTPSLGFIPTTQINSITDALNISYAEAKTEHSKIKEKFMSARKITITTPEGTNFTIKNPGIPISSDGNYTNPGMGGNIPAGEVYMPVQNCEGKIVVDASIRTSNTTIIPKNPIIINVKKGRAEEIIGGQEAEELEKSLVNAERRTHYPERVRRIGEFGVGLNKNAKIIGTTIIDEKVFGTAHIAMGSNYWFGGKNKTVIHLDQVFKNPKIVIDGKELEI